MATFNKFQPFVANVANKVFNLGSDSLKVALTDTIPVNTNNVLADLTEIAYTNLSSRAITTTSSTQSGGTYSLVLTDLVLTASGTVAQFRYVAIYDDTAGSKNLIGWFDYGSEINMLNTDTLTLDFDNVTSLFTLA